MERDIAELCVKVEDTSTFPAAIASKHIVSDFHIQMSFSICAKWAPAVQLCAGIPYDFDTKQVHYLLNVTSPSPLPSCARMAFSIPRI